MEWRNRSLTTGAPLFAPPSVALATVLLQVIACKGTISDAGIRDSSVNEAGTGDGSVNDADSAVVGCGNTVCEGSETSCTCPGDCGTCNGCCDGDSCVAGDTASACGQEGETCDTCAGGEACTAGDCVCTDHDHLDCFDGDVYWFDSCGNMEELSGDCGLNGCEDGACRTYTCVTGCRNGSEECDDEGFTVTSALMVLVCVDGNNGIAYIATNSGPQCLAQDSCDGINGNEGADRCRGFEQCECEHAWEPGNLDYVVSMECTAPGMFMEVDLSAYLGANLYVGVHDNPNGGGHMNEVCVAVWD